MAQKQKTYTTGLVITGDSSGAVKATRLTENQLKSLNKTKNKSTQYAKSYATQMGRTVTQLTKYAAVVGGAVVAAGAAMVKQQLTQIDTLAKTADKLGITTKALTELRYAAELTGVDSGKLDVALQRMTRRVSEAAMGTGEAKDALKELGLDAKELAKQSPDKTFKAVADAMSGVANQNDRVRLAFKLFDSEGVALVNTLKLGTEGFDEIARKAEIAGINVSRLDASKIEQANDAIHDGKQLMDGFAKNLTIAVAPALTDISKRVFNVAEEHGGMAKVAGKSWGYALDAVGLFSDGVHGLKVIFKAVVTGILGYLDTTAGALNGIVGWIISQANKIPGVNIQYEGSTLQKFSDAMGEGYRDSVEELHELMMKPLPSDAIKDWNEEVTKASTEVAKTLTTTQGVISATAESAKKLSKAESSLLDSAIPLRRETREYNSALAELNRLLEVGKINSDEYKYAVDGLTEKFDKAKDSAEKMAREADPFAKAWEEATKRIDESFADAWTGAFDSFSEFSDRIKDSFKKLLAELAHQSITKPILVNLGLSSGSGGSWGSLLGGSSGSGGSGGGGLGGLASTAASLWGGLSGFGSALSTGWSSAGFSGALSSGGSYIGGLFGGGAQSGSFMGAWDSFAAANGISSGAGAGASTTGSGGLSGSLGNAASYWPLAVLAGMYQSGKLYDQGVRPDGNEMWDISDDSLGKISSVGPTFQSYKFEAIDSLLEPIVGGKTASIISGSTFHQALWSGITSKLFGSGQKYKRTVGSGSGTYSDGEFVSGGVDPNWYSGSRKFGDDMDDALTTLSKSFSTTLGSLFEVFGQDIDVSAQARTRLRRTSGRLVGDFSYDAGNGEVNSVGQYSSKGKVGEGLQQFVDTVMGPELAKAIIASELPDSVKTAVQGLDTFDAINAALSDVFNQFDSVNVVLERLSMTAFDIREGGLEASDGLLKVMGGLEGFQSATNQFYGAFYSAEDKFSALEESLKGSFESLDLIVPQTRGEFRSLVESMDLTSAAAQAQFASMMALVPSLDAYYSELESQGVIVNDLSGSTSALNSELDAAKLLADSLAEQVKSVSGAFMSASDAAREAFDQINGAALSARGEIAGSIMSIQRQGASWSESAYQSSQISSLRSKLGQGSSLDQIGTIDSLNSAIMARYDAEAARIQSMQSAAQAAHDAQQGAARQAHSERLSEYQQMIDLSRQLKAYSDSLLLSDYSPLTNEERLNEAKSQYGSLLMKAQAGDVDAAGRLQGAADSYLSTARKFYASGDEYSSIFDNVRTGIGMASGSAASANNPGQFVAQGFDSSRFAHELTRLQEKSVEELASLDEMLQALQEEAQDSLESTMESLEAAYQEEMGRLYVAANQQIAILEQVPAKLDALKAVAEQSNAAQQQQLAAAQQQVNEAQAANAAMQNQLDELLSETKEQTLVVANGSGVVRIL